MPVGVWARPLHPDEESHLRKSKSGEIFSTLGPLAIMGLEDNYYIKSLNIPIKMYRVNLGGGQYIDEVTSKPVATGGKKVSIVWGLESALGYVISSARELSIPVVYVNTVFPADFDLIYFEAKYLEAFADGFSYADKALGRWHQNRFFLSRWFGSLHPDYDSPEAKAIRTTVRNIILSHRERG